MLMRVPKTRFTSFVGTVAILAAAGCDAPLPTEQATETNSPFAAAKVGPAPTTDILLFADGTTVVGEAALVRRGNGVTLSAHMAAEHGETFTVWAVVFNNPGECAASPCAGTDLANPDVAGNVIRIAGGIAGGDGLHVSGRLREGDASEGLFPGGPPLQDGETAEIHFIYRSHGQKIPGRIADQTMTVGGGCDTNVCEDVAFSIHLP